MREGEITISDPETLREMLTYIVTDTGALEAEPGKHDDCVMALALCNHIHEGAYEALVNRDEWYAEAI